MQPFPYIGDGTFQVAPPFNFPLTHTGPHYKKLILERKLLFFKEIVTACAGCFSTLSHEYAEDLNAPVKHIVEFVDELIQEGRLTFPKSLDLEVTYHDPCHVGRYCDIYDAPRNILKALPGVTLTELTSPLEG